jgi:hypothetical protein
MSPIRSAGRFGPPGGRPAFETMAFSTPSRLNVSQPRQPFGVTAPQQVSASAGPGRRSPPAPALRRGSADRTLPAPAHRSALAGAHHVAGAPPASSGSLVATRSACSAAWSASAAFEAVAAAATSTVAWRGAHQCPSARAQPTMRMAANVRLQRGLDARQVHQERIALGREAKRPRNGRPPRSAPPAVSGWAASSACAVTLRRTPLPVRARHHCQRPPVAGERRRPRHPVPDRPAALGPARAAPPTARRSRPQQRARLGDQIVRRHRAHEEPVGQTFEPRFMAASPPQRSARPRGTARTLPSATVGSALTILGAITSDPDGSPDQPDRLSPARPPPSRTRRHPRLAGLIPP